MSRRTEDAADTLRIYLREVRRTSLLDREEEQRLIRRLEEGRRAATALAQPDVPPGRQGDLEEHEGRGREARDQIVRANLRLVVRIARRYVGCGRFHGLELSDLIQEGNLGLLRAVEKLEPGYGKVSTFVAPWIRRTIRRALANQGRLIRVPVKVHVKLERLSLEENRYLVEKGRPPTPEELAEELDVDLEGLVKLRIAETEVVSLSQPAAGDGEEWTYEDLVEDPGTADFAERALDRQWLAWLFDGLSERSRRVLEWHFRDGLTLEEIGIRENVSRQRILQIKSEALEKLMARHAEGQG